MARRKQGRGKKVGAVSAILQPDAAGADIGAEEIYVAVPADRDEEPVRHFPTFTQDLHRLADWLERCRIRTIAMEATSVYWIPLYEILEARGLKVCLVNARHVKHVPGRKSDVSDCQWLQYLHSVGLLRASFRPDPEIRVLRSYWRHRESLVQMASQHVQHMAKALDQMNLQVHHVLSDITGVSGMDILAAIVGGERDAQTLADLCQPTVRSSRATMIQALTGNYQREHLFTLRQSLNGYRFYQRQVMELDQELQQQMQELFPGEEGSESPPPSSKNTAPKRQHNAPHFDLHGELYRIAKVDLCEVPGISTMVAQTILSEVGPDLSRFPNMASFVSWLGLCPDQRVSGGKVLSSGTRRVKNRAALALRLGAQALHHAKNYLGEYFRRMKSRLGAPQAITATAHKLARIVYHLLCTKQPYDASVFARQQEQSRRRFEQRLRQQAHKLGYHLTPLAPAV